MLYMCIQKLYNDSDSAIPVLRIIGVWRFGFGIVKLLTGKHNMDYAKIVNYNIRCQIPGPVWSSRLREALLVRFDSR